MAGTRTAPSAVALLNLGDLRMLMGHRTNFSSVAGILLGTVLGCGNVAIDGPSMPASRCPTGNFGGRMLEVTSPSGSAYCIDTHEVTVAQYASYLATAPEPITSADCVAHSPEPAHWSEVQSDPNLPVRFVNWCQAGAFCKANGKRLCGRIGGGSLASSDEAATDPERSEWFNACSAGGRQAFPYGHVFEAERCSPGSVDGLPVVEPPGSREGCEGGFPGLFDMNGNVSEFENSCEYTPDDPSSTEFGPNYVCIRRGELDGKVSGCSLSRTPSQTAAVDYGIRCCADVVAAERRR